MDPAARPWRWLTGPVLRWRRAPAGLRREHQDCLAQIRRLTDEAARREERACVAAEMNDLLGHRLALISLHAGALQLAAERQAPPPAGQAELLRTLAATALGEVRGVLGVLHHRTDGKAGERGTHEDLSALVADARSAGADAHLHWDATGPPDMDARTRQAVHRVAREGLDDALRHAPGAPVRMTVRGEGDQVVVSVVHGRPGHGRSAGDERRGAYVGLRERVGLLGGTLDAGPRPDGGFGLRARIPVRPEEVPVYGAPSPPVTGRHPRPAPPGRPTLNR